MSDKIESYLNYIMSERNFSSYTIANYKEDLKQYEDFVISLTGEFEPLNPDVDVVRAWMAEMAKQKLKATTIKRRLCALRSFYKYLRRKYKNVPNEISLIPSPKVPKPLPVWVTESQMDSIIDDVEFGNDFEGKRDRLLVDLIYSTGMRRSEASALKTADVDFGNKVIRIIGKGNKMRLVPFGQEIETLLKEFIEEKKHLFGFDTEFLLTNEDGEALSPHRVASIAHSYLSTIPTLAKQTTHVLRHSFATNMLANGADLMAVKELLGHASLQSTEVYTHLTPQEIISNYKQAHPRSKN